MAQHTTSFSSQVRGVPPLVSVVIPARNAARTLAETVESVRAQRFIDWEMVIVDDGSTDGTAALARQCARRDARIRVIAGPRRGVSAARNAGVAATQGQLIAFIDADDLWEINKLELHVERMRVQADLGVSFDRVLFVDVKGRSTGVRSTPRVYNLKAHDWLYENPASTASTLVVRREVFVSIGGFDESMRFAEDLELLVRIVSQGRYRVDGVLDVLTRYRASPNGASANLEAMQQGWETLMEKVRSYQPMLVGRHYAEARAVHLRYLARRATRLGQPAREGFGLFWRALLSSPLALLRQPKRTCGTLAGLALSAVRPL